MTNRVTLQEQDRYCERATYKTIILDIEQENLSVHEKLNRLNELTRAHAERVFETHPDKLSDLDEAIQGVFVFMRIVRNLCVLRGIQDPDEAFELFGGNTELPYFWGFEGIFAIEMAHYRLT
jgi:hypothetical protein